MLLLVRNIKESTFFDVNQVFLKNCTLQCTLYDKVRALMMSIEFWQLPSLTKQPFQIKFEEIKKGISTLFSVEEKYSFNINKYSNKHRNTSFTNAVLIDLYEQTSLAAEKKNVSDLALEYIQKCEAEISISCSASQADLLMLAHMKNVWSDLNLGSLNSSMASLKIEAPSM